MGPSDNAYLDDFDFSTPTVGTTVDGLLNTIGTPQLFYMHRIELPLDDENYSDAIHMDVVRLQNSDLQVMVINSEDHLTKLLWTPTGPRYLGTEDVIAAGLLDRTRSAKGELEVQQDGSELVVAYSHALRFWTAWNIVGVGVGDSTQRIAEPPPPAPGGGPQVAQMHRIRWSIHQRPPTLTAHRSTYRAAVASNSPPMVDTSISRNPRPATHPHPIWATSTWTRGSDPRYSG